MATLTVGDLTPRDQYTATSGQTVFTYSFPIFNDSDLKVYVGSTLKTLTTHYTVSGAGTSSGGNITFGSGLTTGDIATIYRDLPVSRTTDYATGGALLAENLNDDLDKLVMMIQQVEYDLNNRVLRFGQFTTGIPLSEFTESATDRAGKVLSFDSSGDPNITQELGVWQGNWAASTAYVLRDIVKDSSNSNVYICVTAHTSSGSTPISSNTDVAKWALLIDAAAAGSSATAAASSATAAASSATAAAASATSAQSSEDDATTAQTAAELAETHAETAETNAETAETAAETAQTAAESAKTSAQSSQTSATASATSATASATSATASASGASSSATDAQSSEDDAATSETNAAASAATATTKATSATSSASSATTSASTATTKASEASTSATNAATSATNAATSATASAGSATTAASYIPTNSGQSGKFLTNNGTANSWGAVDALPTQTGNAGKYLTTDASTASWATLDTDANTTTKGLYEHAHTINTAYSITSTNNAMSAGPVVIGSSGSVTVPATSVWTIV